MSKFKKAEKKKAKLRLGITGPSGSGKTYSALRLATGLGGKIAFIDSEKGSASLYADKFDFDVLELEPPYAPERYIECLYEAIKAGYEIVIMDSISHAWAGQGGLLNRKEQLDARGGNSFANWAKMTPIQEKFIAELINCPAHLIVTMRSKQEYIIEQNDKGKQAPRKVGLAPIQRDGFEYELTTVFDVAINHEAEASKDRTGLFVDKIFKITENTGEILKNWLENGSEIINQNKEPSEKIQIKTPEREVNKDNKQQVKSIVEKNDKPLSQEPIVNHAPTNETSIENYRTRFSFGSFKAGLSFAQLGKKDTTELLNGILKWKLAKESIGEKIPSMCEEFIILAKEYLKGFE